MLGQQCEDRLAKQVRLARKGAEQLHFGHAGPPRDRRRRRPAITACAKLGLCRGQQLPADLVARTTLAARALANRFLFRHGHDPSCQPRYIVSIH